MPNEITKIYMYLLDEGLDVWRPVQAEHLKDNIYRVLIEQPYDRETEKWLFEPGDEVICDMVQADIGPILAAIKKVDAP